MTTERIDRAERAIAASAHALYQAFLDPALLERWLPPAGMTGKVHECVPVQGGGYVMSLYYGDTGPDLTGKTSASEDRFRVVFDRLDPAWRVVQRVMFDTADPGFAGAMTQTWTFAEAGGVTTVSVACENVPAGILAADHRAGLASSLENLAVAVGAGD